jgi:cytochrome c peroxidase
MARDVRWLAALAAGVILLAGASGVRQWALAADKDQAGKKTRAEVEKVHPKAPAAGHECELPHEAVQQPFKDEQPMSFVSRGQDPAAWEALKAFWNPTTEKAVDPQTGLPVERRAVKIRLPLGLNAAPSVPAENPMTVAKWKLGKKLYFDEILSSDGTVSCATCHDPKKGFTDQSPFSTGIAGKRGGMSAPTVYNSAYNAFQFWDGRAASLEHQAQGPVGNAVEMFNGAGHAWQKAVGRLRADPEYVRQFKLVFGTGPTQDGAAKAIATYERTVLSGNSIHDRAELAMRKRVDAEETGRYELKAADYAAALRSAFAAKDAEALRAVKLSPTKDQGQVAQVAKNLLHGRAVYFGKARCNSCHVGENFTDNTFHNLGVGVKADGKLPAGGLGRFASAPVGHKNPAFVGAFKTPTLRHLLGTGPYMHDGSKKTLKEVVEFYDRGGNANEYLDNKMRDEEAERAWYRAKAEGKPYKGPEPRFFNGKAIIPLKLNLTKEEKEDLVLFLGALQGDLAPPVVADRARMPQ